MTQVIYKFDIRFPCMSTDSFACDLPISTEGDRLTGLQIKEIAAGFVADLDLDEAMTDTLSAEDWNLIAMSWDKMCDEFASEWDDEQPLLYLHYTGGAA
jgi:hypothetical protein